MTARIKPGYHAVASAAIDWGALKAEYTEGSASYRQLAVRYGISLSSVAYHGRRENWAKQRRDRRTEQARNEEGDGGELRLGGGKREGREAGALKSGGEKGDGVSFSDLSPDSVSPRGLSEDEKLIRSVAILVLEKLHDGVSRGEIQVSPSNLKQITGAVKDLMDILGVMTQADAEEHNMKLEKLRGGSEIGNVISVILGDAEEWSE